MKRDTYIEAIEGLTEKYDKTNSDSSVQMEVKVDSCTTVITIAIQNKAGMHRAWVDKMLREYRDIYARNSHIVKCDSERKIMAVQFCNNWNFEHGFGMSLCSPNDKFDSDVGLAVAFAHFRDYPIPDYV